MSSVRVRLQYPLQRVAAPVVTHLVRDFDVSPNVLAGNIDAHKGGWLQLTLTGDAPRVERALAWVREQGIEVTVEDGAA